MRHPAQTKNGNKSWTYYKYDAMNRQVMTGEIEDARSRSALQDQLDAYTDEGKRYEIRQNNDLGYSRSRTFPYNNSKNTVYTISYFDDYKFITYQKWDSEGHNYEYNAPGEITIKDQSYDFILGKTTGSKVRVFGDDQETWLNTVVYYDNQGRVVQTVSENHVGGTDRLSNELTWEGELRQMLIEHTGAENTKVLREYGYDRLGQLVKTYQTINPGTQNSERVLLAAYDYNILGELKEKRLHSLDETSFIQAITYDYNFQGALTQINNPSVSSIFAAQFNYEDAVTIGSTPTIPRFDGMMTSQIWRSNEVGGTKHATGYAYDGQNRLDHTTYGVGTGTTYNSSSGHFSMDVSYEDDNANIHSITRNKDGSPIDDLTYFYELNTNKLKDVDDAGTDEGFDEGAVDLETEYTYDAAGNMTADGNKRITAIEYNHLQLVSRIEFFDFTEILYTYYAVGNRLSKEVRKRAEAGDDPNTIAKVDYVGVIEYLDGAVNQIFTDEGRAYKQNDKFHYEYFITDHQANNRVAFGDLPERNVYTATMESHRSGYEESHFAFPANIRTPVANNVNHTPLGDESIWLNGTNANRRLGLAKVLDITTGDEVDISAWAKYTEADGTGTVDGVIATILATLGLSSTDNAGGEALFNHLREGGAGTFVPISDPGDPFDAPDAYIAYLFFDDTYTFDPSYSGFLPVTSNSLDEFEQLKLDAPLKIEANGSLFIYMANETEENQEVYFDDFKITHSSASRSFKVTQVNEFYPFGLPTSNSWRAPGYVDPGLLYQSSYASYDSLTGYYVFLSRSYDPVLGRFFAVDPAGQFSSPYVGMGNMPHAVVDPNGEISFFASFLINLGINIGSQAAYNGGQVDFGSAITSSLLPGSGGSSALDAAGKVFLNAYFNSNGDFGSLNYEGLIPSASTAFLTTSALNSRRNALKKEIKSINRTIENLEGLVVPTDGIEYMSDMSQAVASAEGLSNHSDFERFDGVITKYSKFGYLGKVLGAFSYDTRGEAGIFVTPTKNANLVWSLDPSSGKRFDLRIVPKSVKAISDRLERVFQPQRGGFAVPPRIAKWASANTLSPVLGDYYQMFWSTFEEYGRINVLPSTYTFIDNVRYDINTTKLIWSYKALSIGLYIDQYNVAN